MITNFDFIVLNALQTVRGEALDRIMIFITYLGGTGLVWIIPGLALLCRRRTRKSGAVILASMILGQLFGTLIIKNIVMRPRPYTFPQAMVTLKSLIISPPMGRWSFPSSHTVTAFAGASGIFFAHKGWGTAALVLAALVGLSRLYLYVHFPTDVLAGAVLGVLCAVAAKVAADKIKFPSDTKTA